VRDFGDADTPAIFEPAELFELFDFFEFTLRESGVLEKGIALKDVEAKVLPISDADLVLGVANPRDGRAGEIERVVVKIENSFDHVRVHDVGGMTDRRGNRGDLCGRIFEEGAHGGVDSDGINEGLVALNVDEDVARFMSRDFRDALGSRAVIGARHARVAAERLDGVEYALVVGGDEDGMDGVGAFGAFVDVLDHGFAREGDQGFAGKSHGGVAGRDNDDDLRVGHNRKRSVKAPKAMLTYAGQQKARTGQMR